MKPFFSNVIQYRGSHYDLGLLQGKQIRNSLIVSNRERQWRLRKPKFSINKQETKAAYETYAPGLWEELSGLSDGLKMPIKQVLRDFGGYRVPIQPSGCSTIVTGDYMIRNYDYHPRTYEGRYVLFAPTDHGYATIGPSQRIVGRMDGMNEHGLSLAYNFINRRKPGAGFICHAIGRIVLENAQDVSEAIRLLREIPHRHSFSYIIADKQGQQQTIEATPRKIITRETPLCTNHFHLLTNENRHVIDESQERMNALEKYWQNDQPAEQAFSLLNDPGKGVFVDNYHSWAGTIHTSAYIPKKLEAWIALGGNQQPTKISLSNWLNGKNILFEKIYGEIHANVNFIHMDHTRH